jgi:hypothetical protein
MLHTCWSIVFECLNSNLYLNSFVCCFTKISRTTFPFFYLPSIPFRPVFVLAQSCRSPAAPLLFLSHGRCQPARPSASSSAQPSIAAAQPARIACHRRPLSLTRGHHSSSSTSRHLQPGLCAAARVRRAHDLLSVALTPRRAPALLKPPPHPWNPTLSPS